MKVCLALSTVHLPCSCPCLVTNEFSHLRKRSAGKLHFCVFPGIRSMSESAKRLQKLFGSALSHLLLLLLIMFAPPTYDRCVFPQFSDPLSFLWEEKGTDQTNPKFRGIQKWFWRAHFTVRFPTQKKNTKRFPPFAFAQLKKHGLRSFCRAFGRFRVFNMWSFLMRVLGNSDNKLFSAGISQKFDGKSRTPLQVFESWCAKKVCSRFAPYQKEVGTYCSRRRKNLPSKLWALVGGPTFIRGVCVCVFCPGLL